MWAGVFEMGKGMRRTERTAFGIRRPFSTLNAHYTSPTVIRSIYAAHGFAVILNRAWATSFYGMLPDTMQDSRLYGVELDSITGRIATSSTGFTGR